MRHHLPSGTVTFLFTDVEGSTRLLHELGAEGYAQALAEHRRALREAFAANGGVEVDTQGDAFFFAFPTAAGALAAAGEGMAALAVGPIRVRVGVHTGTPHVTGEGYVGADVHRAARIGAVGHGGQVVVSAATAAAAGVDGLRKLGEHRLKDFDAPVPLYQLGESDFPPLKTISNTNLPRPASSFVGREREVEEVAALLRDGARFVTLTGPGGTGKTRLAIQAAATLVPEFKAGVFWVGLAALRDPALVTETIAQALGAKDGLTEHIGERELLVLLDNLEQVVAAAPELASLVEACPNLHLLLTSRERLRVRGEHEYQVPPLAEREAVELFCARAQTEPDDTVRALCRALDNLPLAVELAAARASVLSPAQILERLSKRLDLLKGGRDADPRQQTLRATIEWSYELLDEEEQQLFARLAVFRGGCTLEAAEEVSDADLDVLQALVDKSLLRRTDERFWMLETIREYAAERLAASGEAEEFRRRHAEHFLALAEEAAPHLRVYSKEWLDRIGDEHDNVRAALDWLEAAGETELAMRLAAAVAEFWGIRGHIFEGRRRLETLLRADPRPTAARAGALDAASDLVPDTTLQRTWAEEALAIHRANGDVWGSASALIGLGDAAGADGDWKTATDHWEESARLFAEIGDEHYTLLANRLLAWSYEELGETERAYALHEANVRRARAARNRHMLAQALEGLARATVAWGRPEDAIPMLVEAYRLHGELGDVWRIAVVVGRFARPLAALGRADVAARVLASGQALCEEAGATHPWVVTMNEETLAMIRPQLDDATFAAGWERGRGLSAEEAVALALDAAGMTPRVEEVAGER